MADEKTTIPSPGTLLALAHLFKLAAGNVQLVPGQVFVLLPVEDCEPLSRVLLAESIRRGWVQDA